MSPVAKFEHGHPGPWMHPMMTIPQQPPGISCPSEVPVSRFQVHGIGWRVHCSWWCEPNSIEQSAPPYLSTFQPQMKLLGRLRHKRLWNKYRTDSPRLVKINNLNSWNFQWELSCEYCDIDISCPHLNLSTWFLSNNDIEHHPFTIGYFKHRYTQQTLVGNTGVCISSLTKQLSKPSGFCPISGLGSFGILQ